MTTVIDDIEFNFKERYDYDSKVWESTVYYKNYEIDFILKEEHFLAKDKEPNLKLINQFINHILGNVDTLQKEGAQALEQAFGKDYYFDICGIFLENFNEERIEGIVKYYFDYRILYVLEKKKTCNNKFRLITLCLFFQSKWNKNKNCKKRVKNYEHKTTGKSGFALWLVLFF